MHFGRLLSEDFLKEGIRTTVPYRRLADPSDGSIAAQRAALVAAFERFPTSDTPDEATTEQDLIFRVLEALGWDRDLWLVQPRASRHGRADVPDLLLFPDAEAKARAGTESPDRRFRHGVAIVESKRWGRSLDRSPRNAARGDDDLNRLKVLIAAIESQPGTRLPDTRPLALRKRTMRNGIEVEPALYEEFRSRAAS